MDKNHRIVVIGAGVFGLSTAYELSKRGYRNVVVLDRHVPPVPDGSSVDISRIIRFDYAGLTYTKLAKEAYDLWSTSPIYKNVFSKQPFILTTATKAGQEYINKCLGNLRHLSLPWNQIHSAEQAKKDFPALTGTLATPNFYGYCNPQAGWADAALAITELRDRCIEAGISFFSGAYGTVTEFIKDSHTKKIKHAKTQSGDIVHGDLFILATGAWTSQLVPMYDSILATGQVLGFLKLTKDEEQTYKNLPIYINMDTGWFCFPPHERSGYLKFAVHGWGYTKSRESVNVKESIAALSSPPTAPRSARANFSPEDAERRLRDGLREVLPELADRTFDRTAICWYTDTPTSDFIIDFHPEYENLFVATGGSGHGFKFLPVLGKYTADALERALPDDLRGQWRFRTEYRGNNAFAGDGSRGGPERREFTQQEKAML